MDGDSCTDITRKPSVGRDDERRRPFGERPGYMQPSKEGPRENLWPSAGGTAGFAERVHVAEQGAFPSRLASSNGLRHARAPSNTTDTGRRAHQIQHLPSSAISVFDESDDSSEEADLARRSARMAPRSLMAAPPAALPSAQAQAIAAGPLQQQQQLLLLLQLQQQLQQQLLAQQVASQQQFQPQLGSQLGSGLSATQPVMAAQAGTNASMEQAGPMLPVGHGSQAGTSAAAMPSNPDPTTQQQLQEQYLQQWTSVTPSVATTAAPPGLRPPGIPPRLLQEASLASSLGAQPVGTGISRGDTAILGSGAGDWAGILMGSRVSAQAAYASESVVREPSRRASDAVGRQASQMHTLLAPHEADLGRSVEYRTASALAMPSQAAPPSLMLAPSLMTSLAGADPPTLSAAGGSVVPPQPQGLQQRPGVDADADAAGAQQPSTGGKARAAPSADQVVENLENIGALALFNQEEEENEDGEEDDLPPPWYRRPAVLWFLGSVGLGLLLLLVGVILHNVFENSSDAFRWLYFFAGVPLLYYVLSYAVQRVFMMIEWWFFRESLFYLHSVQYQAAWLLTLLMLLPWFHAMFRWSWCSERPSFPRRCQQAAYLQATNILWNCLLCLMLFCLANLLKAVLAKLLTTHFYRTAHFKQLKKALEKEYVLQVLSRPRRLVMMERARAQAHAHAGSDGQLGAWFSMSVFHHGPVSGKRLTAGAAGGEAAGTGAAPAPAEVSGGAGNAAAVADAEAHVWAKAVTAGACNTQPGEEFASAIVSASRVAPFVRAGTGAAAQAALEGSWPPANGAVPGGGMTRVAIGALGASPVVSASVEPPDARPGGQQPRMPSDAAALQADRASTSVTTSSGTSGVHQRTVPRAQAQHSVALPAPDQTASLGGTPGPAASDSLASVPQPKLSGLRNASMLAPAEATTGSGRRLSASVRGATAAFASASMTGRGLASGSPRLFTGRAAAGGLDASLGAGGLLRRQDSRASRVSWTSVLKGAAKAPAAVAANKGDEAVSQAMVEVVPPGNTLTDKKGLHHMTEAELEAVRTAIVIKTQTALITKYADKSEEDMAKELGRVRRFARALYFNVLPPGAGRATLRLEDFTVFFEGGEAEAGEAAGEGPGGGAAVAGSAAASAAPVAGGAGGLATKSAGIGGAGHTAASVAAGGAPGVTKATVTSAAERAHAVRRQQAEEAAKKAFAIFDTDGTGEVSRSEVREAVVNIYKERRNMAKSLKDTETIVKSLEFGIGVVIHFLFAAVYLLIWGVDLLTGFSTFSATVLGLTFVFGNSVKNMYESMLFLFVVHPYDVGDCVLIGTEMYRVKKISLLYTDMVRWNGERVYMPNTTLIGQNITNWTRSKTKCQVCRLVCDVGVAWEVREDIQAAMRAYAREHPGEFDGEPACNFTELVDPLKVVLICAWNYNFAPDDFNRLGPSRNGMLFVVQQKAREHGLQHTALLERVYK